jgi:hypothetical protein
VVQVDKVLDRHHAAMHAVKCGGTFVPAHLLDSPQVESLQTCLQHLKDLVDWTDQCLTKTIRVSGAKRRVRDNVVHRRDRAAALNASDPVNLQQDQQLWQTIIQLNAGVGMIKSILFM